MPTLMTFLGENVWGFRELAHFTHMAVAPPDDDRIHFRGDKLLLSLFSSTHVG